MSTDYRFTIKRKADGKELASFYYNRIKNVGDVYMKDKLAYDPNNFHGGNCTLDVDVIQTDIMALKLEELKTKNKIEEKKVLSAKAASVEIKEEFDADIRDLEEHIDNIKYAKEALVGLEAVVICLTEDLIVKTKSVDDGKELDYKSVAYSANAEGLKDKNSIFVNDVKLEVVASY